MGEDLEEMVLVSAGQFWRGCNEVLDNNCWSSESPYHEVTLSSFLIDRTEVTQRAYQVCVEADVCIRPSCIDTSSRYCFGYISEYWNPDECPNCPVSCLEWEQAKTYCEWIGKRLPTEAEWEKAARGTDGQIYPWGNNLPDCTHALYQDCERDAERTDFLRVQQVGSYPNGLSPYGALDMAGNVWEWVADWYDQNYYTVSPNENPTGPESGSERVRRGGAWCNGSGGIRTSSRNSGNGNCWRCEVGVRCAAD